MKEIRQIKKVVPVNTEDVNNNAKTEFDSRINALDALESEPGYFQLVVKPMLAPGHASELVYWMKSMGLIPHFQICKNCQKQMTWIPSRVVDLFQWKCNNCNDKTSIRQNSPFIQMRCDFKTALRVLLGWCKGKDIENISNILGVKKQVVTALYNVAHTSAEKFIKSNLPFWQIGGKDVIVLVDTFPEGCTNDTRESNRPILCLAELKVNPPRFWFQALGRYTKNNIGVIATNKRTCLEVIKSVVQPGTVLVTRMDSTLCSYKDVTKLKHLYPVIVSTDGLSRHDSPKQIIHNNLSVIWKEALNVCLEAQYYHHTLVQSFLVSYMWRQRFQEEGFQMLLNELSAYSE